MEASLITLGQYLSVDSSRRIPSQEHDASINQNCCEQGQKGPEASINTIEPNRRCTKRRCSIGKFPLPYITARLC